MRWEWDGAKAAANLQKHGVSFEVAVQAVLDPLALVLPDPHTDGNRWRVLGRPVAALPQLLFVIHTEPVNLHGDWIGRIISARSATPHERRVYEEG